MNLLRSISLISDELLPRGEVCMNCVKFLDLSGIFILNLYFVFESNSEVKDLGREETSGLKCSLGNLELLSTTISWLVFLIHQIHVD